MENMLRTIQRLLRDMDPEGLLASGAPENEYDGEAQAICKLFAVAPPMSVYDVHRAVRGVLIRNFEPVACDDYMDLARAIWSSNELARLN